MKNYYINLNRQSTGEHEIHTDKCIFFSSIVNKKYLGIFNNAIEAKEYALSIGYTVVDGCFYCCSEAHKR